MTNVAKVMDVTAGYASKATAKSSAGATSFQTVMNQTSGKTKDSTSNRDTACASTKRTDNSNAPAKQLNSTKDNVDDKQTVQKTDPAADSTKDVTETVSNQVEETVNEIKDAIKEALGISDEDIDQLLETLGLTAMDLLQPDCVLKVVMQQSGVNDQFALLNNAELVDTVKSLMENIQNIKADLLGNVDPDIVQEVVEQIKAAPDENAAKVSATTNETADDGIVSKEPEITIQAGDTKESAFKQMSQSFGESTQQRGGEEQELPKNVVNGETVYNNLSQAVSNSSQISYSNQSQAIDIINQVVEQIKLVVKADTTQMEMQLNPESLGKVNITVASREGMITAQISAQTEAAKNALESQIVVLKEAFQNQGLKVEAVEVTVSPHGFDTNQQEDNNQQQQQSSKSRRHINLGELDLSEEELTEDENIAVDMMQRNGNRVDFTA